MVVYTLIACSVAIAGNLTDTQISQAVLTESSRMALAGSSSRPSLKVRVHSDEAAAAPLIENRGGASGTNSRELAKRNVTESIKVPGVSEG